MNQSKLRIIFAGTPEFAATALDGLLNASYNVVAVYTQPDRPAGRGRKLMPSPVKQRALESEIPVYQPLSLKTPEAQEQLSAIHADLMIVAAYGLLLPKAVLDTPRLGCVNIHASLLPRWRGAAPIQRAIIAGDEETGITIMQMDVGLDTGDMLFKLTCPIQSSDTAQTLHDKLAQLGSDAMLQALPLLEAGKLKGEKQNDQLANYAQKLKKEEAEIDWAMSAVEIERRIRAFIPWPVAQTRYNGEQLRIWEAKVVVENTRAQAGEVIGVGKYGFDVVTGGGLLRVSKIQLPGGNIIDAGQFATSRNLMNYRFTQATS